ncbi:unnamed protein product [Dibothriocephalus latus]|uniref:Uncharacterized protein n=1 Tax=Dibothriocephalus latus TaxID=60516 RepID=A0A3P7MZJ5_DIBLA|nr:unnamed protein product [Dibothriocephalus latus]
MHKKSTDEKLLAQCPDIQWHFIGRLQSNKIKLLLSVPNLSVVETISSLHIATLINKEWAKRSSKLLDILLQVNTSGEEQKGGIPVPGVVELYKSISESCDKLRIRGIMTIGKYGYDPSLGPNPDFVSLVNCRESLCHALDIPKTEVELSMGMSTDFEQAIELGSQFVRVGSSIFGSLMSDQANEVRRNEDGLPIGKDGKPLKPCCACPETRLARDNCIIQHGEEHCKDFIDAHTACLRALGFKI